MYQQYMFMLNLKSITKSEVIILYSMIHCKVSYRLSYVMSVSLVGNGLRSLLILQTIIIRSRYRAPIKL